MEENNIGVKINQIKVVNPYDNRGLTYEVFKGEPMQQITASKRIAGSKSGDHFHKGENPSRNPEINFILEGKGVLEIHDWRDEKIDYEKDVEEGHLITILPKVYHTLYAKTNMIILERMVVPFDPKNSDIYRGIDEYKNYIESLKSKQS